MRDQTLQPPRYLGDSVYAHYDGYHIVLVADGHKEICIEPEVFESLLLYAQKVFNVTITVTKNLKETAE